MYRQYIYTFGGIRRKLSMENSDPLKSMACETWITKKIISKTRLFNIYIPVVFNIDYVACIEVHISIFRICSLCVTFWLK